MKDYRPLESKLERDHTELSVSYINMEMLFFCLVFKEKLYIQISDVLNSDC